MGICKKRVVTKWSFFGKVTGKEAKMRWNVEPIGNRMVLVNDIHKQPIDDFIQCVRDENKRLSKYE